jgi:hypothetical protein
MWTTADWYAEARALAATNRDLVLNMTGLRLEFIKEGQAPAEEARQGLLRFHKERFDAVPDLTRYPELRGIRELLLAENRGIRDGAGLDDLQLAGYVSGSAYYHRFVQNAPRPSTQATGKAHCSYIYFPRSDRGPLLANNLDTSPKEMFGKPVWPAGNEFVIMGGVSSGIFMDEQSPEIFPAPVYKLISRYCRNAPEAVEMLTRYNHFWGPCNRLVTDRQGRTAMIEKSACRIGVRWSPDGFGFITAMTAEDPGMNAFLADRRAASVKARGLPPGNSDEPYWAKQDARRLLMNELLAEARKNPTYEVMRQFIQFRDPVRGNVCGFGERCIPDGPESEFTIRTMIFELRAARAHWWAQEGNTPSWKRPMPDECFPDVLPWD